MIGVERLCSRRSEFIWKAKRAWAASVASMAKPLNAHSIAVELARAQGPLLPAQNEPRVPLNTQQVVPYVAAAPRN